MKKGRKILGFILTILSLLLTGQVSLVMRQKIRKVPNPKVFRKNLFAEQMLCMTFLVSSLDIMFHFFGRSKNALIKLAAGILRVIFYASAGVVLFFGGKILIGSLIRHKEHAEYAMVLGMTLENGRPTKDLLYRVDAACEYLKLHPNSKLILTGGNPDQNGITEAEVMKKLLIKRGVKADRLLMEDKSDSTKQNFANTTKIINPEEPVVLITSSYHMDRAVKIAKKAGFKTVYRLPAKSEFFPYTTNVFWEVLHNINEYTGIVKDT